MKRGRLRLFFKTKVESLLRMVPSENTIPDPASREITVRSFKYDGREHKRWRARIVREYSDLIVLDANFEEDINHPTLGIVERGTRSLEYYWHDRWFNVFRFHRPAGELRNFYCNINVPPVMIGDVLSYIDLDIDILVSPDLSYKILDEDEFASNAIRFNYPPMIRKRSLMAIKELSSLIEASQFPFNDLM